MQCSPFRFPRLPSACSAVRPVSTNHFHLGICVVHRRQCSCSTTQKNSTRTSRRKYFRPVGTHFALCSSWPMIADGIGTMITAFLYLSQAISQATCSLVHRSLIRYCMREGRFVLESNCIDSFAHQPFCSSKCRTSAIGAPGAPSGVLLHR